MDTPNNHDENFGNIDKSQNLTNVHLQDFVDTTKQTVAENIKWQRFVEKYERETQVGKALNKFYYKKEDGWFAQNWLNNFYDESNTIFANKARNAKVFAYDNDTKEVYDKEGETFWEITKVWNLYFWVTISTKKPYWSQSEQKIDGSEKYVLLDKKWDVVQRLRGRVSFWENKDSYTEYYTHNDKKYIALYDNHFNKLIDNVPYQDKDMTYPVLSAMTDDKLLFVKSNGSELNGVFAVVDKNGTRDGTYKTKEEISNEPVYQQYEEENKKRKDEYESLREEKENLALNYTIEFKGTTWYIDQIIDKDWKVLFVSEKWMNYKMQKPSYINSPFDVNKNKKEINTWLFLLYASSEQEPNQYHKDVFVNANNGDKLEFENFPWNTYLIWNVVKHFINNYECELYDAEWNKLGISHTYRNNEHDFELINNTDWTLQIVENKTWTLQGVTFDKILKTYTDSKELHKYVVVEKHGEKEVIEINTMK